MNAEEEKELSFTSLLLKRKRSRSALLPQTFPYNLWHKILIHLCHESLFFCEKKMSENMADKCVNPCMREILVK